MDPAGREGIAAFRPRRPAPWQEPRPPQEAAPEGWS